MEMKATIPVAWILFYVVISLRVSPGLLGCTYQTFVALLTDSVYSACTLRGIDDTRISTFSPPLSSGVQNFLYGLPRSDDSEWLPVIMIPRFRSSCYVVFRIPRTGIGRIPS